MTPGNHAFSPPVTIADDQADYDLPCKLRESTKRDTQRC